MISRVLICASAGIVLFLGSVRLAYTLLTDKFSPREKQLETAMKQVSPHISGETLTDVHLKTAEQFRLVFTLPDYLRELYKSFGITLDRFPR